MRLYVRSGEVYLGDQGADNKGETKMKAAVLHTNGAPAALRKALAAASVTA